MKCLRRDFICSISGDDVIVSANANNPSMLWEDISDPTRRYLYKEGDRIVTPFGIQTIKEIDKNYSNDHGYEWLITVKENGNQYKPCELLGIYVRTLHVFLFKP